MNDLQQRIFALSKELQLMNFSTITEDGKPWVRYVVGKADNKLVFRFCTHKETRKAGQIRKKTNVHLSLGVTDIETASHWVQVQGTDQISTDKAERHDFWFDALTDFFSGPDDPDYCVVIVTPTLIEFGTMGSMTPEIWKPAA